MAVSRVGLVNHRRLHLSVYTRGKNMFWFCANTTYFAAEHLKFEVGGCCRLDCFRSTKYSLQKFLDVKNNFWRQVCCFWARNTPESWGKWNMSETRWSKTYKQLTFRHVWHPITLGARDFSCAVSGFGQVLKSDPLVSSAFGRRSSSWQARKYLWYPG